MRLGPSRNLAFIGAGDVLSRAISFATFILIARALGPSSYGLIAVGASLSTLLSPLVDFGLGFIGTREIARRPDLTAVLMRRILLARFALAILALGLIALGAFVFFEPGLQRDIVLLYGFTIIPGALNLTWLYQGVGRGEWFFVEKNVQAGLYLIAVLVAIEAGKDAYLVPLFLAITGLLPSALLLILFLRRYPSARWFDRPKEILTLLRSSVGLFVSTLVSSVSLPLVIAIVATLASTEEVAFFSAGSRVIVLSAIIPNMLWSSYYPSLAGRNKEDRGRDARHTVILLRIVLTFGIILVLVGVSQAGWIVRTILGDAYERAVTSFGVLTIVAGLQMFSIVFTRLMPAFDREGDFRRTMLLALIVVVVSSLALVPTLGALGAAVSFVFSEAVVCVSAGRFLNSLREIQKGPV